MSKKKKKKPVEKSVSNADLLDDLLEVDESAQLLGSEGMKIKIRGVISTQCPGIDYVIGRGGIPLSRLTIIHGKEGSGKTTLALHLVAECQKQGGVVIYIDKEYKLDPEYAGAIGVDTENLLIVQPPYLEKVFQICEGAIKKSAEHRKKTGKRVPILIVLDSVNAAITKAEFEGEWEAQHMAPQARVFSRLLPKLMPIVSGEDVALVFVSQIRKKINVQYGNDEEVSGGNAPKFYASLVLKIAAMGFVTDKAKGLGGERIANKVKVTAMKNQVAPPFRKAMCEIRYGKGFDREASLIELAVEKEIIEKSGAWFSYGERRLGQGAGKAAKHLRKCPEIYDEILEEVTGGRW